MCAFKVALDGNEVLWICEFGFSPGCCPGEHKAPSVALALLGSGDNSVVWQSLQLSPLGWWQLLVV